MTACNQSDNTQKYILTGIRHWVAWDADADFCFVSSTFQTSSECTLNRRQSYNRGEYVTYSIQLSSQMTILLGEQNNCN